MAKRLAKAALEWMGTALHLTWPSFTKHWKGKRLAAVFSAAPQVVFAHPSHRLSRFSPGTSADVILLPGILFSRFNVNVRKIGVHLVARENSHFVTSSKNFFIFFFSREIRFRTAASSIAVSDAICLLV